LLKGTTGVSFKNGFSLNSFDIFLNLISLALIQCAAKASTAVIPFLSPKAVYLSQIDLAQLNIAQEENLAAKFDRPSAEVKTLEDPVLPFQRQIAEEQDEMRLRKNHIKALQKMTK
jgi:hypothetical protein